MLCTGSLISFLGWHACGSALNSYVTLLLSGRSKIFFRRGCTCLLLYFNTNKPHSFFCRIPVVLENRRSSQGGCTPCTLPLDPPILLSRIFLTQRWWLQTQKILSTHLPKQYRWVMDWGFGAWKGKEKERLTGLSSCTFFFPSSP